MITSSSQTIEDLKRLLLFGDNPDLFEKELIKNYDDGTDIISVTLAANGQEVEIEFYHREYISADEYHTTIEKYKTTKLEIIKSAIHQQYHNTIEFLKRNFYEADDYSSHKWLYARVLNCFLKVSRYKITKYPYRDFFLEYFIEIVRKCISFYDGIIYMPNLRKVNQEIGNFPDTNKTGYKLKPLYISKLEAFTNELIEKEFIYTNDKRRFKEFLLGKVPEDNVVWRKKLHYFVYLINKLNEKINDDPSFLLSPPNQKWKYLDGIFSFEEESSPNVKFENHNKLGKIKKSEIDSIFDKLK